MLILVLRTSELDQAHIFQHTCENIQIHPQVITCHFEGTNHDNHQKILFQSFFIPF